MIEISDDIKNDYTMGGQISICDLWFDVSSTRQYYTYSVEAVNNFIKKANNKEDTHYLYTDQWLYSAIEKYPIRGDSTLIIGSEEPCYEGVAIAYGATVTTLEYQKIISEHPLLKTTTIDEFCTDNTIFDSVISISSIEHSGLGRYGEALDPNGDIKIMETIYNRLKNGGICFLAVPIGIDQILWNAHRVYGRRRLPLLINKFKLIDSFGLSDSDYDVNEFAKRQIDNDIRKKGVNYGSHQPILVLQK